MNLKKLIANFIFSSRWLLIPFYIGLFIAMLVYTYVYVEEIVHLISGATSMSKDVVLLTTLELVDIVMIANLVKMIITGSYNSFVDKSHGFEGENISSGMLKVKMSTSLIGVSSIHLLQTFISPIKEATTKELRSVALYTQLGIHWTFLIGALILAIIDYLHVKGEALEPKEEKTEHKK